MGGDVHPATASETADGAVDKAIRIQHVGALHGRVSNTF